MSEQGESMFLMTREQLIARLAELEPIMDALSPLLEAGGTLRRQSPAEVVARICDLAARLVAVEQERNEARAQWEAEQRMHAAECAFALEARMDRDEAVKALQELPEAIMDRARASYNGGDYTWGLRAAAEMIRQRTALLSAPEAGPVPFVAFDSGKPVGEQFTISAPEAGEPLRMASGAVVPCTACDAPATRVLGPDGDAYPFCAEHGDEGGEPSEGA